MAIGIPLGVIVAVVGSVMLFGQVRKYRRKKMLEKERKVREAEEAVRLFKLERYLKNKQHLWFLQENKEKVGQAIQSAK